MKKKILILGGSYAQLPFIKEAKARNYYIILIDYLENNPGQEFADEYFSLSTTDLEGVLELAEKIKPDYIYSYASDPAAITVAYVSEQLHLHGNSLQSVKILSEKDLFRNLLIENGFNCPKVLSLSERNLNSPLIEDLEYPVIVKPTDSSGSKGVTKVDSFNNLDSAMEYALTFSRNRRVIIEEFIDNELADIHGDGFVIDGKLEFISLGDHIYSGEANPFNPTGTKWPSKVKIETIKRIESDLFKIIELTGFKNGPINIEARINHKGIPYVMEIGPRNGGHFVPQAIMYATGFDMIDASFNLLEGNKIIIPQHQTIPSAYIALYSNHSGVLDNIEINKEIQPFVKEFHQYIKIGENVQAFTGANAAIGIVLLSFDSTQQMDYYTQNIFNFIKIGVNKI